jgi:hypothetical protein
MTRSHRFLPGLLLALTLGACATAQDADAEADTRTWISVADGAEARLAYGTPDSDDAPLLLHCRTGSGRVTVSLNGAEAGEALTLASGGRKVALKGSEEPDLLHGEGVIVTADARADHPVMQGFRNTGRLAFITRRGRAELPATAEERTRIRGFLDSCRAAA